MHMMRSTLLLAGLLACGAASANSGRFFFDNDTFGGSDRYYTNAVRLEINHDRDYVPGWAEKVGLKDEDSGIFPLVGPDYTSARVGYWLAHYMYTSSDRDVVNPPLDDRPYFGWLVGGVTLERTNKADYGERLSVGVGVSGPSAKGDQLQSWVHEQRDISKPAGWDTQAGDEVTFDVSYTQTRKMTLWGKWDKQVDANGVAIPRDGENKFWGHFTTKDKDYLEFLPRVGLDVGTTFIQAHIGGQLRLGFDLPRDFGPSPIYPAAEPDAAEPAKPRQRGINGWNAYLLVDVDGRLVGRNASLDGPAYRGGGREVDKEPWVTEYRYGAVVTFPCGISTTYIFTTRDHEFEGQKFDQSYGSVQVSWDFDPPRDR